MSWTRMSKMNMPQWMVQSPWGLSPTQMTTGNWAKLGAGENLPQGQAHQLIIQYQIVSTENKHPSDAVQTEQFVFTCLGTHTPINEKKNQTNNKPSHEFEREEGGIYDIV